MPDKVEQKLITGEIREIRPNPAQKVLNRSWKEMIGNLPDELTGVVCNGDMCDGNNRKSVGRGVWTTDLRTQVKACAELLKPIQKRMKHPKNFFFSLGSEYHVVDDRPLDQAVCDELGGHFQPELLIPMLKGEFRVQAHHVINGGLGAWQYRTTSLARDQMLLELNAAEKEYGQVNWILRAHAHYQVTIEFSPRKGASICPCWQGKTEFGVRKGMINVPRVGYSLLKIYEDGSAHLTFHSKKLLNPCKEVEVE